jgi:hypothetical protein
MNFVPAASSFVHHAAYAGNVDDRGSGVQCKRYQADCWSVITPAQILPASSRVYRMNFVPLLLVHLCNTPPALSMLMITLWRHSRDSMLTAGL